MKKPINRPVASALHRATRIKVSNHSSQPREHAGGVIFCGYADLEIFVAGHPFLCLKGTAIKLINGDLHFDPKSEPGKNSRNKERFPHWIPLTPEARAVFNYKLGKSPEIMELIDVAVAAVTLPEETGAATA